MNIDNRKATQRTISKETCKANSEATQEEIQTRDKITFRELMNQILHIIKVFIMPYKAIDGVKDIPEELLKKGNVLGLVDLVNTIVALIFSFLLKASNLAIENKLIFLGIFLFLLFRARILIDVLIRNFKEIQADSFKQHFNDDIISWGAEILSKTSEKVFKYDQEKNISKIVENDPLINCIKEYTDTFWHYRIEHKFDIYNIISILIMLIIVFITNTEIPNEIFIPLVIFFIIINFIFTAYKLIVYKDSRILIRKCRDIQDVLFNDMKNVKAIVPKDLALRLSRFRKISKKNISQNQEVNKKFFGTEILTMVLELIFELIIIGFYIFQIGMENVTLETITIIAANLAVLNVALSKVNGFMNSLYWNAEKISRMDKESSDLELIIKVFQSENEMINSSKPIDDVVELEPFQIQYERKNESDQSAPFTLVSPKNITIRKGEVTVFTGVSGSGKSTVMKILMDKVRIGSNVDLPSSRRFLYYDDTLKFGSLPIYDEFFVDEEPDIKKAFSILKSLHLSQELKFTEETMENWMRTSYYSSSMSHGQCQRMILAKILYHLDDNIDGVLLDEVTSGLDEKANEGMDVQAMLEYCIRYANSDKRRIVLLSVHQSIDGVRETLLSEGYKFKIFQFGDGKVVEV